ncbi:hypothetical protein [Rhizobium sp. L1K21]|uniref:hypothetical protein n=1 Tax=Rhizobium sp. L1K21 TaxID=2954933 RepID=UPI002093DCA5|nr:hypothetical protein [Rhizobium sp. L1K21]MCO6187018.1 hypothetical protein [Rhizobium sp. L1K21]
MKILKTALAAALLMTAASQALSSGMTFKIHNQSDYIINGFYVAGDDGELSPNWMDFELNGGESADMQFSYDGDCDINFVVGWVAEDGSTIMGDLTAIDICDANNIYFDGENATYD